jgi:ribosomal-protein-alanine N-acetyltransferase
MAFFRNVLSLDALTARPPTPEDQARLLHFFRRVNLRFFSLTEPEFAALLQAPVGQLLLAKDEVVACMLAGLAQPPATWIRATALDDRVRLGDAMPLLLDLLHRDARAQGLQQIYFLSDLWSGSWLQTHLRSAGYAPCEEVVSYEKHRWTLPAMPLARLPTRPATEADVPAIVALDAASFEPRWAKLAPTVQEAIQLPGLFLLAEEAGLAGYAFASLHHGGRYAHLVRIAVDPAQRGKGIGAQLLTEVCRFCERRGVEVLSLNTQTSNATARRLYEQFGFIASPERQSVLELDLRA